MGKLRLMSNNQWWCDKNTAAWQEKGLDCSAAVRAKGFARVFSEIDADIIGLQECSMVMADQHMQNFSNDGVGYALLWGRDTPILYKTSKFELVFSDYLIYPSAVPGFSGKYNNEKTKSYCIAVFREKESGKYIVFGTTHLWYRTGDPKSPGCYPGSDEARVYQLGLFMDKAESLAKEYGCPAVIVGDFNANISSPALKSAFLKGWSHARDVATDYKDEGHGMHKCDWESFEPYVPRSYEYAIDHILLKNAPSGFVKSFVRYNEEYYMPLSDHLPVYIDVDF